MVLSLTDLPDEIISLIYFYLPLLDSYNFSRICKSVFYKNYHNNEGRIPNFDMLLMYRSVENSELTSYELRTKCRKIRENLSKEKEIINITDFNLFKCPDFHKINTPASASLDKIIYEHPFRRDSNLLSLVGAGTFDLNLVNWNFEIENKDYDVASRNDAETSTLVQLISCSSEVSLVKGRNMFTIKKPKTLLTKLLKNTTRFSHTLDQYDWKNISLVERIEKHWNMNIDFDKCEVTDYLIYRSNNGTVEENENLSEEGEDEVVIYDGTIAVPITTSYSDRNVDNESYNFQDDYSNVELGDSLNEIMEPEGVELEISTLKYSKFISATFESYIVLFTSVGPKSNIISCYTSNDHNESESDSESDSELEKESKLIWENKFIDNQQLEVFGFTPNIKVSGHFVFVSFEDNDPPETIGYYVFSLETGKLLGSFKLKPDNIEYTFDRSEINILGTHIFLDRFFYQDAGMVDYPSYYQLLAMPIESFISQLDTKCIDSEIVITTTFETPSYTPYNSHMTSSTKTKTKYRTDNFEALGWKIIFQTPPSRDLCPILEYEEINFLDIIPYFWGSIIALLILYEVYDPRYPEDELVFLFLYDTVTGERKYIEFGYWNRSIHGKNILVDDRMNFVMLGDGFVEVPLNIEDNIDMDIDNIINDRRIHIA